MSDETNFEHMQRFVERSPWVLQEPTVCTVITMNPKCYVALKKFNWWATVLSHVPPSKNVATQWTKNGHVHALAYEATAEQIVQTLDWPAWEMLVQDDGPYYARMKEEPFDRTRALVGLANRIDIKLAPLMCAAMHVLLPLNQLALAVDDKWSPLQKAQYAWFTTKTRYVGDIWPTPVNYREPLRQAQAELFQWINLVEPQELTNLHVLYELNNSDLAATISEWIQLAQQTRVADSFDYTHALDNTNMTL